VRDHLDASLSYSRHQYDGLLGREQDQALASMSYQFDDKSSLSLIGRWSRAATKDAASDALNENALLVTYTIPFQVAVSRKRSVGVLTGRLIDPSKSAGVPRVVLQVGEQFAVTDEAGCFEFPGLKPGACELRVVQDSLNPRLAITTPLPMKVRIRPADTTRVTLEANPACSVAVRVVRHEFADGNATTTSGALKEAGGLEAAVIELTNGRDTWRALTDRTGHVSFDRLPPGRWTLRIASSDLPPFCTIETPERLLTLATGANEHLTVRILPMRRTVRMVDHGSIR